MFWEYHNTLFLTWRILLAPITIDDAAGGRVDVPGQEFSDPVDGMVDDTADDIAQIASGSRPLSFTVSIRV